MENKVTDMRKILNLVDELKPHVKKSVSDEILYEICAKYICSSDKKETAVKKKTAEKKSKTAEKNTEKIEQKNDEVATQEIEKKD